MRRGVVLAVGRMLWTFWVVLVMTLMSAVALSLLSLSTLMILSRNFASYAENTRLALK